MFLSRAACGDRPADGSLWLIFVVWLNRDGRASVTGEAIRGRDLPRRGPRLLLQRGLNGFSSVGSVIMLSIHRTAAAVVAAAALAGSGLAMTASASAGTPTSFIGRFSHLKNIVSPVPRTGGVNPDRVAVVRHSPGKTAA